MELVFTLGTKRTIFPLVGDTEVVELVEQEGGGGGRVRVGGAGGVAVQCRDLGALPSVGLWSSSRLEQATVWSPKALSSHHHHSLSCHGIVFLFGIVLIRLDETMMLCSGQPRVSCNTGIEREAIFREMTPRRLDMCVHKVDIMEDPDYLVVKKNLGGGWGGSGV